MGIISFLLLVAVCVLEMMTCHAKQQNLHITLEAAEARATQNPRSICQETTKCALSGHCNSHKSSCSPPDGAGAYVCVRNAPTHVGIRLL